MDQAISRIATGAAALLTLVFFLLSFLNAAGAVRAHFDADGMHRAQACGSPGAGSDCISSQQAYITKDHGEYLVQVGEGDAVAVEEARVVPASAGDQSGDNAKTWNGKIVSLTYAGKTVETTDNPDAYLQTWPVTLALAVVGALVTAGVYLVSSWATGYAPFGGRWRRRSAMRS